MMEIKETAFPKLFETLPPEFKTYFTMVFQLEFAEVPKYTVLRNLFKQAYTTAGYLREHARYDWEV